jgi:predicted transcriptional regulator
MKEIELLLKPKLEGMSDPDFVSRLIEECGALANAHSFEVLNYLYKKGQSYWTQMILDLKMNPNALNRCLKSLKEYGIVGHGKQGFYLTEGGRDCLKYISALIILSHSSDEEITKFFYQFIKD